MAVRDGSGRVPWPLWGLLVTAMVGLLLGAHQREAFAEFSLLFSYGYWVVRLVMAYLLFAGCLLLLEASPLGVRLAWGWLAAAAALITLPFFTLGVTMLDLLLGLPEMGLHGFGADGSAAEPYSGSGMAVRFAMEAFYHLDNHLALCALIVTPRVVLSRRTDDGPMSEARPATADAAEPPAAALPLALRPAAAAAPAFLDRLDPPPRGAVWAVQAQEHYVRVVTAEGSRCTLYRFGDALRELEGLSGIQVHRSFWVADAGVAKVKAGRRGVKIVLRNGEQVPVSARHADLVQRRYNQRPAPVA